MRRADECTETEFSWCGLLRAGCLALAGAGVAFALACGGDSQESAPTQTQTDEPSFSAVSSTSSSSGDGAADSAWADWDWSPRAMGLPEPPPIPADNPLSAQKIQLGHELFMDKRLSVDGSRSCYSCHQNQFGNADGRATALGAGGRPLPRNSPTIWNVAYREQLYWDGRAGSLEAQALGAWRGGNMGVGAEGLPAKAAEIGALPEYRERFAEVFGIEGDAPASPEQIAQLLASYERTLLCGDASSELGDAEVRGRDLFMGEAGCVTCHSGPEYTDGRYHAIGIGFDDAGEPLAESPDLGRARVTEQESDNYTFRTPTLRNVSRTGPYFHDGSVETLEEAVRYMASGGNPNAPNRDPLLRDAQLSDEQIDDLVSFLRSLQCVGQLEVIGDQSAPGITDGGSAAE